MTRAATGPRCEYSTNPFGSTEEARRTRCRRRALFAVHSSAWPAGGTLKLCDVHTARARSAHIDSTSRTANGRVLTIEPLQDLTTTHN